MTVNELIAELLAPIGRNPLATRTPINNSLPSVGVSTQCGAVSTRGITVFVPELLELLRFGRIYDPGMEPYPARVRRDLDVGGGAIPAASWFHEPQPITNQSVGMRFPHLVGRYRPGRSPFSSPGCWSCRDLEEFLIRG